MHPDEHAQPSADVKPKPFNEAEKTKEYWIQHGKDFIESRLKLTPNTKKARNIIMFLGDGLSHTTIGKQSCE
jgi:alkaline phosphatase